MRKSTVERAFEIAREGQCLTVQQIRRQLAVEGYPAIHAHLEGATIGQQLRAAMQEAAASGEGNRLMPTAEQRAHYAHRAVELRAMAAAASDADIRQTLEDMALSYDKLVDEADRIASLRRRLPDG